MNFLEKFILIVGVFSLLRMSAVPIDRQPAYPFISGDGFRALSDHVYDELSRFDPVEVQKGEIVFVRAGLIQKFYEEMHPYILNEYILISHNGDLPAPSVCPELLDDSKIIVWFAENGYQFSHPKLIPIPIGIENRCWPGGNPENLQKAMKNFAGLNRDIFIYLNITIRTFPEERQRVYDLFANQSHAPEDRKEHAAYLEDLAKSVFVVSPRGNGYDCHRTWESLYMGAIPIVRSSFLDCLFEELPVVIVSDWKDVTEEFLRSEYEKIKIKSFNKEKLYMDFWKKRISLYQG